MTQPPAQPTFAELVTAMKALSPPAAQPAPAPEREGLAKHAGSVVAAVFLALCLWVGTSVMGMTATLARLAEKLDSVDRTLGELSKRTDTVATATTEMRAQQAAMSQRLDVAERNLNQLRDSVRIVEGQAPLGPANDR